VPRLVALNADFREAWHEYPETLVPEIELYRLGEGPFAADGGKIKQVRFLAAEQEQAEDAFALATV
jgi:phenylacetate-CoA ligase